MASTVFGMAMGPELRWIADPRHHATNTNEAAAVLTAAYLLLCCAIALLLHLTSRQS